MNIVLANGTLITIDETSELFWAMKGAGHNFGKKKPCEFLSSTY